MGATAFSDAAPPEFSVLADAMTRNEKEVASLISEIEKLTGFPVSEHLILAGQNSVLAMQYHEMDFARDHPKRVAVGVVLLRGGNMRFFKVRITGKLIRKKNAVILIAIAVKMNLANIGNLEGRSSFLKCVEIKEVKI